MSNNIPEKLPEDFAEFARIVMWEKVGGPDKRDSTKRFYGKLTTSKLRRFLALIVDILNDERLNTQEELQQESIHKLMTARVRFAYEVGRDTSRDEEVRKFVDAAGLMTYIKNVGKSRKEFLAFAGYMEALVAWHRYYGGREN